MPPQPTTWDLEPHTKAKHELLRKYLGAWYPIMASAEKKVAFIDGFAGPGVYRGGEPGSPIVAISALVEHTSFQKMASTKFLFAFVDEDLRRTASLQVEIDKYFARVGGQPKNVEYQIVDGTFEDVAKELSSVSKGKVLVPSLAFIDPFGFGGVSMDTICRLTSFPKCEVVFSFMYNSLNRWITHPKDSIHVSLRDLFGTDEYEAAGHLHGEERREFLHELYKRRLVEQGKFKYALDFEMRNLAGKNVYSLIFATRHLSGLRAMKGAMWDVDPTGGFRFEDRHAGSTPLFQQAINFAPLRSALQDRFAGETVLVEAAEEFVLADTIFRETHYKKQVLKPLEGEGLLTVPSPKPGRRAGTYPPGTVLRFTDT